MNKKKGAYLGNNVSKKIHSFKNLFSDRHYYYVQIHFCKCKETNFYGKLTITLFVDFTYNDKTRIIKTFENIFTPSKTTKATRMQGVTNGS